MPRYFFDVEDSDQRLKDREGIDLFDAWAARLEAASLLAVLLIQVSPIVEQVRLVVTVRDADGNELGRHVMEFLETPVTKLQQRQARH